MVRIIVRTIIVPYILIVVAVYNQQSGIVKRGIPALQLTVLQHEELVLITFIIDDIALAAILQRLHVLHLHILSIQFDGLEPSGHPHLITGITGRLVAVVIVGTIAHQVPRAHALTATVVDVVEVGISQTVRELVTDSTHATNFAASVELGTAGIGADLQVLGHSNRTCSLAVVLGSVQIVGMRPDGFLITAVSFAHTGIDHIHLVYLAIIVPVVLLPVGHLVLGQVDGLDNHLCRTQVAAFRVVAAVIAGFMTDRHRTYDVEVELKLSAALSLEIVGHRALELTLREALLVGNTRKQLISMLSLECLVLEVDQDNQSLFLARIMSGGVCRDATGTLGISLLSAHLGTL